MRVMLLLLCLLLAEFSYSQSESNRICWTDSTNLTWNDFLGEKDSSLNLSAVSNIELPYTVTSDGEVQATINISACFSKTKSWYKKKKQNNVLLKHEQLHFDIAELYKRMIVKMLKESNITNENYRAEIDALIEKVWNQDYRQRQDLYDQQTNFSRLFKPQIKWINQIKEELIEYEKYSMNEITITFQSE